MATNNKKKKTVKLVEYYCHIKCSICGEGYDHSLLEGKLTGHDHVDFFAVGENRKKNIGLVLCAFCLEDVMKHAGAALTKAGF